MSAVFRAILAVTVITLGVMSPDWLTRSGVHAQRGANAGRPQDGPGGQRGGPPGREGAFFRGRGNLPTGTAAIRGRVTSDTGAPLHRATVRATLDGLPGGRATSTDQDGRFEFLDLPGGNWSLLASKPGFVTQRFGQHRPSETVPPIELANGQRQNGIDFRLLRGGVITGRLQDDFGEPVANVRVRVQRSQMVDGRRRLTNAGSADQTDDTGAFRLHGLAPGEYFVSAVLQTDAFVADRAGYAPTYYPGTGNAAEAQRIVVGAGEEIGIAFALLPVRLVRVSGTVITSGGAPAENAVVSLANATESGDGPGSNPVSPVRGDGAFTLDNVAPGSYVLNVRSGMGGGRGVGAMEFGSLPLVVGDGDLAGVTVSMSRGASLAGTVVKDGTGAIDFTALRVTARILGTAVGGLGQSNARVSPSGTFQLGGLSGLYSFHVERVPEQWTVKSIVIGSADVTDTPLDLRGTEQASVRVVLTDRVTEVNGSAANQRAGGFSVVVFADDAALWPYPSRFVRSARADARGQFKIRGLPAGSYLAAAMSYLEDGDSQDAEFLQRLREGASAFSVRDGDTRTLSLRVIDR